MRCRVYGRQVLAAALIAAAATTGCTRHEPAGPLENSQASVQDPSDDVVAIFDGQNRDHRLTVDATFRAASGVEPDQISHYTLGRVGSILSDTLTNGDLSPKEQLTRFVEAHASLILDRTGAALDSLPARSPQMKTVIQPNGLDPFATHQYLMRESYSPEGMTPLGSRLTQALELGRWAPREDLSHALAREIDRIHQQSPAIASAKKRFEEASQRAAGHGIVHYVAASNDNVKVIIELGGMEELPPPSFTANILSNPYNITVGGSMEEDAPGQADDRRYYASPDFPEVDILADATNVGPGRRYSGNSYAVALAAGEAHPQALQWNLSTPEVVRMVSEVARPVLNSPVGTLDPGSTAGWRP